MPVEEYYVGFPSVADAFSDGFFVGFVNEFDVPGVAVELKIRAFAFSWFLREEFDLSAGDDGQYHPNYFFSITSVALFAEVVAFVIDVVASVLDAVEDWQPVGAVLVQTRVTRVGAKFFFHGIDSFLHDYTGRWEEWSRCLVPEFVLQGSIDAYEWPGLQILPADSFAHIVICKRHPVSSG